MTHIIDSTASFNAQYDIRALVFTGKYIVVSYDDGLDKTSIHWYDMLFNVVFSLALDIPKVSKMCYLSDRKILVLVCDVYIYQFSSDPDCFESSKSLITDLPIKPSCISYCNASSLLGLLYESTFDLWQYDAGLWKREVSLALCLQHPASASLCIATDYIIISTVNECTLLFLQWNSLSSGCLDLVFEDGAPSLSLVNSAAYVVAPSFQSKIKTMASDSFKNMGPTLSFSQQILFSTKPLLIYSLLNFRQISPCFSSVKLLPGPSIDSSDSSQLRVLISLGSELLLVEPWRTLTLTTYVFDSDVVSFETDGSLLFTLTKKSLTIHTLWNAEHFAKGIDQPLLLTAIPIENPMQHISLFDNNIVLLSELNNNQVVNLFTVTNTESIFNAISNRAKEADHIGKTYLLSEAHFFLLARLSLLTELNQPTDFLSILLEQSFTQLAKAFLGHDNKSAARLYAKSTLSPYEVIQQLTYAEAKSSVSVYLLELLHLPSKVDFDNDFCNLILNCFGDNDIIYLPHILLETKFVNANYDTEKALLLLNSHHDDSSPLLTLAVSVLLLSLGRAEGGISLLESISPVSLLTLLTRNSNLLFDCPFSSELCSAMSHRNLASFFLSLLTQLAEESQSQRSFSTFLVAVGDKRTTSPRMKPDPTGFLSQAFVQFCYMHGCWGIEVSTRLFILLLDKDTPDISELYEEYCLVCSERAIWLAASVSPCKNHYVLESQLSNPSVVCDWEMLLNALQSLEDAPVSLLLLVMPRAGHLRDSLQLAANSLEKKFSVYCASYCTTIEHWKLAFSLVSKEVIGSLLDVFIESKLSTDPSILIDILPDSLSANIGLPYVSRSFSLLQGYLFQKEIEKQALVLESEEDDFLALRVQKCTF